MEQIRSALHLYTNYSSQGWENAIAESRIDEIYVWIALTETKLSVLAFPNTFTSPFTASAASAAPLAAPTASVATPPMELLLPLLYHRSYAKSALEEVILPYALHLLSINGSLH